MFALLLGFGAAGCADDPAEPTAPVGEAAGPLVISNADSQLEIGAPDGEFNMFSIYASYDVPGCGLTSQVYGVLGPSGVRVEDCPNACCPALFASVSHPGFDLFACLAGSQECEDTWNVEGLTFADLDYETPLCGAYVAPRRSSSNTSTSTRPRPKRRAPGSRERGVFDRRSRQRRDPLRLAEVRDDRRSGELRRLSARTRR